MINQPRFEQSYIAFILGIMGKSFFENLNNKSHPLFKDYWAFKKLPLNNSSSEILRDSSRAQAIAMVNAKVFSIASSQRKDQLFVYGDFSDLGSASVAEDIKGRLGAIRTSFGSKRTRGKNTESLITELCIASWLKPLCHDAKAMQDDSMPDFICPTKKLAIECKTFTKAKTIDNFLDKHISKADKQLDKAFKEYGSDYFGILVFDLTRYFSTLDEKIVEGNSNIYPDEYFLNLERKISTRSMKRKNIHWVLYYWDEINVLNSGLSASILRRSRWVKNSHVEVATPPLEVYQFFLNLGF